MMRHSWSYLWLFNGPLVLELWLIVDQVALIQSVAYALWYTVAIHLTLIYSKSAQC